MLLCKCKTSEPATKPTSCCCIGYAAGNNQMLKNSCLIKRTHKRLGTTAKWHLSDVRKGTKHYICVLSVPAKMAAPYAARVSGCRMNCYIISEAIWGSP